MPHSPIVFDDFTVALDAVLDGSHPQTPAAYAYLRTGLASPAATLPEAFWSFAHALLEGPEDLVAEQHWRHLTFLLAYALPHARLRSPALVRHWLSQVGDEAGFTGLARAALLLGLPEVANTLRPTGITAHNDHTMAGARWQVALARVPELPAYPEVAATLAAVGHADTLAALLARDGLAAETRSCALLRLSGLAPARALPLVVLAAHCEGTVSPAILTALLGATDPAVRAAVLLDLVPWMAPAPPTDPPTGAPGCAAPSADSAVPPPIAPDPHPPLVASPAPTRRPVVPARR